MENSVFRKGLVIGIIVCFVGAGVFPSISGDIGDNQNTEVKNYVDVVTNYDQLDQSQTEVSGQDAYWDIWIGNYYAQSFKPTLGKITKVELLLSQTGEGFCSYIVCIDGELGHPEGGVNVPGVHPPIKPNKEWIEFVFDEPIYVDIEQTYYIEVMNACDNHRPHQWWLSQNNPYSRGCAWFSTERWENWRDFPETDLCFKTYGEKVEKPPVAEFTWSPQYPDVGETVTFDASSSYDPDGGDIVIYAWDLDENVNMGDDRWGKIVTWTYPSCRTYTVKLWIKDDEGETGIKRDDVTVCHTDIEITYPEIGHWCTERICIPVGILERLNWGLVRASRLKCETETTGSIDKVVFYVECPLGHSDEQTDESPPFECTFRSNLPDALAYTLTATAYYNNQNVAEDVVGPICFWKK